MHGRYINQLKLLLTLNLISMMDDESLPDSCSEDVPSRASPVPGSPKLFAGGGTVEVPSSDEDAPPSDLPSDDEEPSTAEGESCKNNGCKLTYSADRVANECIYHPGIPVFHEGMKYWSCCQRKTTEFQEFMDQAGCETGNCKWVADKKGGLIEPNHSLNIS